MSGNFKRELQLYLPVIISLAIAGLCLFLVLKVSTSETLSTILMIIMVISLLYGSVQHESVIPEKLEAEDPYYYDDLILDTWLEKHIFKIGVLLLSTGFVGMMVFVGTDKSLLHDWRFYLVFGILGILVATIVYQIMKKIVPDLFVRNERREGEIICVLLGIIFYVVFSGSFYYQKLPAEFSFQEKVELFEIKKYNDEAILGYNWEGDTTRFAIPLSQVEKFQIQDSIELSFYKNILQILFIKEVK